MDSTNLHKNVFSKMFSLFFFYFFTQIFAYPPVVPTQSRFSLAHKSSFPPPHTRSQSRTSISGAFHVAPPLLRMKKGTCAPCPPSISRHLPPAMSPPSASLRRICPAASPLYFDSLPPLYLPGAAAWDLQRCGRHAIPCAIRGQRLRGKPDPCEGSGGALSSSKHHGLHAGGLPPVAGLAAFWFGAGGTTVPCPVPQHGRLLQPQRQRASVTNGVVCGSRPAPAVQRWHQAINASTSSTTISSATRTATPKGRPQASAASLLVLLPLRICPQSVLAIVSLGWRRQPLPPPKQPTRTRDAPAPMLKVKPPTGIPAALPPLQMNKLTPDAPSP